MPVVFLQLLCNTNDDSALGADHATICLTKADAQWLTKCYAAMIKASDSIGVSVFALEIFDCAPKFGTVDRYDPNTDGFEVVPCEQPFSRECPVECQTVKIMKDGVVWSASHKNGGRNDYFETPELSWAVIEKVAKARSLKTLVGILPAAHFEDSSDDSTGTDEEDAEAAEA